MNSGKRNLLIGIGAIVLLIIIVVGYYYTKYNTFYQMNVEIKSSWAQVENQLQRRYDLIPNLVETVKGYAKQEKDVMVQVTEARAKVGGTANAPVSDKIAANNQLSGALSRLMVVVEKYPDLKSNQNFMALQDELAGTENRIAVERMRYNEKVENYNKVIGMVPGSIVAARAGFKPAAFFEAPKEAKEAPKVKF